MAESELFDVTGRLGRSCQSLFVDRSLTPGRHAGRAERAAYDAPYGDSADVTIYHNPNCNSSVNAVRIAEELGVDARSCST